MLPKRFTFSMNAATTTGYVVAGTTTSASALVATGSLMNASGGVGTPDIPRRVAIYATYAASGTTLTVAGFDRRGYPVSEAITCPGGSTGTIVAGTIDFMTASSFTISAGATGGILSVGTATNAGLPWVIFDYQNPPEPDLAVAVTYSSSANMAASLLYTYDNVFSTTVLEHQAATFTATTMNAATGNTVGVLTVPAVAARLYFTNYSTGTAQVTFLQAGR